MTDPGNKNSLQMLLDFLMQLFTAFKELIISTSQYLSNKRPDQDVNLPESEQGSKQNPWRIILIVMGMAIVLSIFSNINELQQDEIPYNQFLQLVKENKIQRAVVTQKTITGLIKPDDESKSPQHFMTIPLWDDPLAEKLAEHKVEYIFRSSESWLGNIFLNWIIPMLILVAIWSWFFRRMSGGGPAGHSFLNIGNKMRIHPETLPKITFDDVAGADNAKQELKESIDFLKAPEKIQRLGGRMPKGVLLVGSPGTSKTLMARAVSGEAGVPFFNISGSEFKDVVIKAIGTKAKGWAATTTVIITLIIVTPLCGFLFQCGCDWPWLGLDTGCNYNQPNADHRCPFCLESQRIMC